MHISPRLQLSKCLDTYRGHGHCCMIHWAWYKQSKYKDAPYPSRAQSFFEMLSIISALVQMKKNMLKSSMARPCARKRGNRKMCTNSHYPRTLQEEEFKQWHLLHWPPIAWLTKQLCSTISFFRTKTDAGRKSNTCTMQDELHHPTEGWLQWALWWWASPNPYILQGFHYKF